MGNARADPRKVFESMSNTGIRTTRMRGNTQPYAEQMRRQRTFLSGEEIVMILTDEVKQMLSSAGVSVHG